MYFHTNNFNFPSENSLQTLKIAILIDISTDFVEKY